MLRHADLHLPKTGWGRIVLAASASRAGRAWTDEGTARQERGLKHRAAHETRTIPIPPELVRLLRAHIKRYGATPRRADLPGRPERHPAGLRLLRGLDLRTCGLWPRARVCWRSWFTGGTAVTTLGL
jgi:hypothetical protein